MTNKEIIAGFFIECYQNHNYEYAIKYMADDYFDHSPAAARSNREAAQILEKCAEMFSDMKVEILDLIEENNMVATRIKYTAIHVGTCMEIPATGKKVSFEALENFKLENGIITESWGYWPDMYIKEVLSEE